MSIFKIWVLAYLFKKNYIHFYYTRLATWIFRDWLSTACKSRYGWKIAKSTLIKINQPTYYTRHLLNPPEDDKAGEWHTAMNAASVLHITWHLYRIRHDYCLPLFSMPLFSFGAINVISMSYFLLRYAQKQIDALFSEIYLSHYLLNWVFMTFLVSFFLVCS